MARLVQKFGGTSMGSLSRLRAVAQRIIEDKQAGHDVVVVVSAMAGETNRLCQLANTLTPNHGPNNREFASLVTTGEHVAMTLLSLHLTDLGFPAVSFSGAQLPIITSSTFEEADVQSVDATRIESALSEGNIVVIGGYQGIDSKGDITTLGRGGSDITAVAIAAELNADECQIFTDVDGVFTADPRLVPNAQTIECLSYEQLLAITQFGAKVVQSRAVAMAKAKNVMLRVLSSFTGRQNLGTVVTTLENASDSEIFPSVGVAYQQSRQKSHWTDVAIVNLNGIEISNLDKKVKVAMEESGITCHGMTLSTDNVCVTIDSSRLARALCILHSQLGLDVGIRGGNGQ